MDMSIILIVVMVSWVYTFVRTYIKLYALNICSLLYVRYTSIKAVKK